MSWLSKIIGVDIKLSRIVPGVDAMVIRKALEALKLDGATLRAVARVATALAAEKDE
ncbi:hypothetical protein [Armatimonas sp.]|uniref:hypothetical protein n=1 Tax=Armatimonas sp. TaxID=1872638 RepID=UPI00374D3C3C